MGYGARRNATEGSDGGTVPERSGLARLLDASIDWYDIEYEFEDVTGRFALVRGRLGWFPAVDGDGRETMVARAYEGPFDLEVEHHRFVVNETKGVYYDRESTRALADGTRLDPLPLLLGSAYGSLLVGGEPVATLEGSRLAYGPDGLWVGDVVVPTQEPPRGGYEDVSGLYGIRQ